MSETFFAEELSAARKHLRETVSAERVGRFLYRGVPLAYFTRYELMRIVEELAEHSRSLRSEREGDARVLKGEAR